MDFSTHANGIPIYYLPGHGGRLTSGLGQALVDRGYEVVGRETVGDFKKLDFNDQVTTIANDIEQHFWREDGKIIANSFGAYLLLHALSKLAPYMGKILLLSPIVGEFSSEEIRMGFIPPYAKRLGELASANQYPAPMNCSFHVGSEDWQSNPENVLKFAALLSLPVRVVPGAGHQLPKDYVSKLIENFLNAVQALPPIQVKPNEYFCKPGLAASERVTPRSSPSA